MVTSQPDLLQRVRRICAELPDTEESSRLGGEPHFYVGGKIFAGCGSDGGAPCVGLKVGLELQSLLVTRPGIHVAKYVGRYGWISVEQQALADDAELERLLKLSYGLITGEGMCGPGAKPAAARARKQSKDARGKPGKKGKAKPAKRAPAAKPKAVTKRRR